MLFDRLGRIDRFVLVETVRPFDRFDRIDRFDCIRLSGNPPLEAMQNFDTSC